MNAIEAQKLHDEIRATCNSRVVEVWIANGDDGKGDMTDIWAVVIVPKAGWYTETHWYFDSDQWRHWAIEDGFKDRQREVNE